MAPDTADQPIALVVAADRRELSGIVRNAEEVIPLKWPVDWCCRVRLHGRRLALVANGPGESLAVEACEVGLREARPTAVINTGFCGALDPALQPGDIVVAIKIESMLRSGGIPGKLPVTGTEYRTGTLITSDRVILTSAEKKSLHDRGGDAVDMEAAALGEGALRHGLPFYSIRAVTDVADEDLVVDFNAARGPDGRFSGWRIVSASLRRPWTCLPELWKLRGRAELAARRLGDFLAGCEFPEVTGI